MTRKDYELLKSWGDLHPEKPHRPSVGIRIRWSGIGAWSGRIKDYTPPSQPFIEGQPSFVCSACDGRRPCPVGGTWKPFPAESVGDKFYATLRALGYTKTTTGDYTL